MTKKLLLTFALLLTAVTGAWADFTLRDGDVWDETTKTLTVNSDPALRAYSGNTEIQYLVITSGVTSIGSDAFASCYTLTTVTFAEDSQLASIGDYAFNYCTDLTSIEIPASVTSIGMNAFNGCTGLTSITIPASVTSIGNYAFSGCGSLATMTVEAGNANYDSRNDCNAIIEKSSNTLIAGCKGTTIPATVTSIGDYAFSNSGLTSIDIPASVTSISRYAFLSCTGLTTVSFAAGSQLTTIGDGAFEGCEDLASITIPASVTSISGSAFTECSSLATMTVETGNTKYDSRDNCNAIIEKLTNTLVIGCKGTTNIPYGVTSIGDYAFGECTGLTTITIPASVTSIANDAFWGCSSLATVTVYTPDCTLGAGAFDYSDNLTIYVFSDLVSQYQTNWSAYVDKITEMPNPNGKCGENVRWVLTGESPNYTLTISGTGAMADYDDPDDQPWKDYRSSITSVVIEDGVTTIGDGAFSQCSGLTSINIPAGVTSIGERAFASCSTLASVSFAAGSQLKAIGDYAFGGCSGLASIEIPASVTSISEYTFNGCSGLTTVSFAAGSQLTTIGNGAFNYCTGLTSIEIPASVTSIGFNAFGSCSTLATVTVEAGNEKYDSRNNCNAIIEKSTNTLIIGCKNTTIPASVTSIGEEAFSQCSGLTSINIPASVTSIGNYAFNSCTGLTTVSFAAGSQLTSIGDGAFQGCEDLASIEIPAGVTSIGEFAFTGCNNLATVTVYTPDCTLGDNGFGEHNELIIYVFSDLVEYYKGADNWSDYASKITGMDIPHGECGENVRWVLTGESSDYTLTISGTGAMADYASSSDQPWKDYRSSIKTVVVGDGVTSIGSGAFNGCGSLTSITIPASVTSIGDGAFNSYSGDHVYVVVPEGKRLSVTIDGVSDPVVIEPTEGKADILGCLFADPTDRSVSRALTLKEEIVTEITVEESTLQLKVNDEISTGASLSPAAAGSLTYTSSNENVAIVEDGKIKALAAGTATITVSYAGDDTYAAAESKTIEVTVSLNESSVSVNETEMDLYIGDTFTIVATTDPEGLDVTFIPDDSGVVSVDENGVVTALKEGTASVIVKVGGDGVYAESSETVTFTVSKVPTLITVEDETLDFLKVNDEVSTGASLTPASAGSLTYTSSNEEVAIVVEGKIKALAAGTATITVSFAGDDTYAAAESKTIKVTVSLNESSVSVSNIPPTGLDLYVGDTFVLMPTTTPDGLNVTYVPDDSGVVSVDNDGEVTALKEGNASILVKVGGDGVYAESSTTVTLTVSKVPAVTLEDKGTDNASVIEKNDKSYANVTLSGRTLYKDGKWNTICLPFDVDIEGSVLAGAEVHTLTDASIEETTLKLTFGDAVTTIKAGVPYIIKWDKANDYVDDEAHNIVNPVFTNVTINNTNVDFWNIGRAVGFVGTYDAKTDIITSALSYDVLLLGGDNTLRYAASGANLGACRAYFLIDPKKVGDGQTGSRIASFSVDFGNGETTSVIQIENGKLKVENLNSGWYTLGGVQLQGEPTEKGVYIYNGKKVVKK